MILQTDRQTDRHRHRQRSIAYFFFSFGCFYHFVFLAHMLALTFGLRHGVVF